VICRSLEIPFELFWSFHLLRHSHILENVRMIWLGALVVHVAAVAAYFAHPPVFFELIQIMFCGALRHVEGVHHVFYGYALLMIKHVDDAPLAAVLQRTLVPVADHKSAINVSHAEHAKPYADNEPEEIAEHMYKYSRLK
jgi:hypothetical protein